jgi:hypothetical protein
VVRDPLIQLHHETKPVVRVADSETEVPVGEPERVDPESELPHSARGVEGKALEKAELEIGPIE